MPMAQAAVRSYFGGLSAANAARIVFRAMPVVLAITPQPSATDGSLPNPQLTTALPLPRNCKAGSLQGVDRQSGVSFQASSTAVPTVAAVSSRLHHEEGDGAVPMGAGARIVMPTGRLGAHRFRGPGPAGRTGSSPP